MKARRSKEFAMTNRRKPPLRQGSTIAAPFFLGER